MKSDRLSEQSTLFMRLLVVNYFIKFLMYYQLVYVRLYKDLWNPDLGMYHIKENLILLILCRVAMILDN